MLGFIKKWLNYILTGSFTLVFAACYGADMALENPKLINAKDNNENPIPGLKVTLLENRMQIDEKFTDENGSVEFYYTQNSKYNYKVAIEDVDGEENLGDFQSKEVDVTNESVFELKLEKKL
jgi:hypothetical protein